MKIPHTASRQRPAGYALVLVLITLALMLMVFASLLYWATTNARLTLRNNLYNDTEAAAESSTENIMTYMMRDFNNGALNSASSYSALFPPTNGWPICYQFSDTNGDTSKGASVGIGIAAATTLNSQYAGLYGFTIPVDIASRAAPLGQGVDNFSASVYQTVQFALIPLFQFAIFYNMDLEINPGAAMVVNGHVHSNNNIWATGSSSSATLTFSNEVEAAEGATNTPSPLDPQNRGRVGNVIYANPDSPLAFYSTLNLPIGGTTNNNPTNVLAILNLPPATNAPPYWANAYSTNGLVYFANASDLIISNAYNGTNGTYGTNISVYYQNPYNAPNYLTPVSGDVPFSTNYTGSGATRTTNVTYVYSWVTNATFYDYRESDVAQAVNIDVGALNTWLAKSNSLGGAQYNALNTGGSTSKSHLINSIYVYNSVPLNAQQLPAVRLTDGQQLPAAGLTVSTPYPLYVKGNYNITTNGSQFSTALGDTANTEPAALLGDAITLLSSDWNDSLYTNNYPLANRNTANITLNAATLEGIVPSNGTNYSGGVENFLRLEENWGGSTISYNGSIVVMFPSQYATNAWQTTGVYYDAPTRKWGFDNNFLNSGRLPPLTPTVRAIIRGNWAAW